MTAIPRVLGRSDGHPDSRGALREVIGDRPRPAPPVEGRADAARRGPPPLPRSQVCALLLTVATATIVVSACKNASGTVPPTQTYEYPEDRMCKIGVGNQGLTDAQGFSFTNAAQGTGCYFAVSNATTTITPFSKVGVKRFGVQSGFAPNVTIRTYNTYDGQQVSDGGVTFLTVPSADTSYYAADVTSSAFPAGRFQNPNTSRNWQLRDSATALFGGLQSQYNPAYGYSILIGVRDDLYPKGLNGPDRMLSTESLSFAYQGGASPMGMRYQWWLDGTQLADTAVQITKSMRAGSHTLKVTAWREGDGTSDTFSKVVTVTSPTCTGTTCPQ